MDENKGQRMMSLGSYRMEQRLKKNTQDMLDQHWKTSWKLETVPHIMITEHHMVWRRGWESLAASHRKPHSNKPGEGAFPEDFFPHHLFERVGLQTSKYAAWPDILVFAQYGSDRQGSNMLKALLLPYNSRRVFLEGFLSQLSPHQSACILLQEN